MTTFQNWFDKKLTVGPFPDTEEFPFEDYDYIINVSDEYRPGVMMSAYVKGCHYFWFPMNEKKRDIGLNSIYGACTILRHTENKNMAVYLHCHAGINRSQAVRAAYYYSRTGKHFEKEYGGCINSLVAMCNRGYLPPKAEMEKFLSRLYSTDSLDTIKISSINNF
jgi:hypothetical protein